jgi:hypothetical protein
MSDRNNNFITEFTEVLTKNDGWKQISVVGSKEFLLVMDSELKTDWLKPSVLDHYNFNGLLKRIETDSEILFLKPSTEIMISKKRHNGNTEFMYSTAGKELHKGDLISRKHMWHMIHSSNNVPWMGKMYRLFFGEDLFLPIRFGNDYSLLVV